MVDLVAALKAAAAELTAAGVPATIDPTKVKVPGALVQLVDADLFDTLAGCTIGVRVLLIAPDRNDPRSLAELQQLLTKLLTTSLEVTGKVAGTGVTLPANPTYALPGLAVPVNLYTD